MAALKVLRRFVANSLLSSRVFPIAARGRAYRLLGLRNRARFSFGVYFGELNSTFGRHTYINARCFFDGAAPVTIGSGCLIGMDTLFLTSTHTIDGPGRYGDPGGSPIAVGDGCWIGARVTVMPGTSICSDVVIAAGAVVSHSITEPGIYGGVPARWIRAV